MRFQKRIVGLITNPAHEWTVIAAEKDDVASLYRGYISILAAVPAVSVLVGLAIAGGRFLGVAGISTAVTAALMSYALALAVPFATSVALEQLAPRFKADGSSTRALKVVAYAFTPIWLAGVFYVFVQLSQLVLIGALYAVYLVYLGVSPVMEAPVEQRVPLTVVTVLMVMVINAVLQAIAQAAHMPTFGL